MEKQEIVDIKIINHKMFTESDYNYLKNKGYSDKDIIKIWDKDVERQVHINVI